MHVARQHQRIILEGQQFSSIQTIKSLSFSWVSWSPCVEELNLLDEGLCEVRLQISETLGQACVSSCVASLWTAGQFRLLLQSAGRYTMCFGVGLLE